MDTARFLGGLGAAMAVAIGAALIVGNDDDVLRPTTVERAPLPVAQPDLPAAAARTGSALGERPAAPPAAAAPSPVPPTAAAMPQGPTPARVAEVEQTVMRLREAGGSDDEAYRARALALGSAFAAQVAEMEAAERAWRHDPAQRAAGEPAVRPQLVTD